MKTLTALIGLLTLPSISWAQTGEDYPSSRCQKPQASLIKAPEYSTKGNWAAADVYNSKIKQYNSQVVDYDSCMRSYIGNAKLELKRIQDDANDNLKRITDQANARLKRVGEKIAVAEKEAEEVAAEQAIPQVKARAVAVPRTKIKPRNR